jgi:NADPH:quinone reductase-like Zn-dependent oxidoreductase
MPVGVPNGLAFTLPQPARHLSLSSFARGLWQAADRGADAVVDLSDEQATDAGLAAAAPGGYDVIIDFLWGGVAPHAMNHARPGGRYIQAGNPA